MPFEKGNSGNPAGRPKGSGNKLTSTAKEIIAGIVEAELEQLPDLLNRLNSFDRIQVLLKLLPYTTAKVRPEPDTSPQDEIEATKIKLPDGTVISV